MMWKIARPFVALILISLLYAVNSDVLKLNAENADSIFSKNQPMLLKFQAPWCRHCQTFEPVYLKLAENLPDYSFASVEISQNQALTARFSVHGIPVVFLMRDGKTYRYDGALTYESLLNFCQSRYKTSTPLSLWSNPIGPVGVLKGYLVRAGIYALEMPSYIKNVLNVPEWLAYVITGVGIIVAILLFTAFALVMYITKIKGD
mmetsp:Transcript_26589/g.26839  ORF Transcript_26589/g.26839 Transcript_26589/m.26839 type:complete len:204 (+) Transcript_26589:240-851(+)